MGLLLMLWAALGAYATLNDVGETLTERDWAILGCCAVGLVVGALLHVRGDDA